MDETTTVTTDRTGSGNLAADPRVFVVEQNGYLTGPYAVPPQLGGGQTVHEVAGHVHAFDRNRDWFECPWCRSEVTGEELVHLELGHECDETTLDR